MQDPNEVRPGPEPAPQPVTGPGPVPQPTIISPTIGRRVHYWPSKGMDNAMAIFSDKQPMDAGVAYVWSDRCVNLTVADHRGVLWSRQSVTLVQEGDEPPIHGGYCTWMPYQLGQTKKTA